MPYYHLDINRQLIAESDTIKGFIRRNGDVIVKADSLTDIPQPITKSNNRTTIPKTNVIKSSLPPKPCCS